ncbi:hypothetical protein [Pseudomonas kurunegalensis]|uniref:hypothetical protein n=1 Tax=Pseudomonas kurunegalensis TaxID=485880 RepID=UPI002363BC2B|nr:hypothetical protein [Pseudomonas kurunegalensis]MDD2133455.1 hypothetical protein [Pseudomonas kurunegalensis]
MQRTQAFGKLFLMLCARLLVLKKHDFMLDDFTAHATLCFSFTEDKANKNK